MSQHVFIRQLRINDEFNYSLTLMQICAILKDK